jgi:hypothetical protein
MEPQSNTKQSDSKIFNGSRFGGMKRIAYLLYLCSFGREAVMKMGESERRQIVSTILWRSMLPLRVLVRVGRRALGMPVLEVPRVEKTSPVFKSTGISLETACEILFEMEQKLGLPAWDMEGIKIWQHLRMHLYYKITHQLGILEKHRTRVVPDYFKELKGLRLLYILLKEYFSGPFSAEKIDTLLISHGRVFDNGQGPYDPYLDPYIRDLEKNNVPYLLIEMPENGTYRLASAYRNCFPLLSLRNRVLRALFRIKSRLQGRFAFGQSDLDHVFNIERMLQERLGFKLNFDLKQSIWERLVFFSYEYRIYRNLLRKRMPSRILLTTGYFKASLIKAAKDLGIEVVEVQHGTCSRYHLGYSFPRLGAAPDYFPDTFHAWGKFWIDITPFPPANIVYTGNLHFRASRDGYRAVERKARQITVISQPVISSRLPAMLMQHRNALAAYDIVYKLHPFEYEQSESSPQLAEVASWPNVRLEKQTDLYRLFAESTFVIGVFSTALYEAVGFGCKVILVDLPGIEYMRPLIEKYNIPLLRQDSEMARLLATSHPVPADDLF